MRGGILLDFHGTELQEASQSWWGMKQANKTIIPTSEQDKVGISFVTISDKILDMQFVGADYSVIGLYTAVVLTIGRFVRMSFSGGAFRVIVEELWEPGGVFDWFFCLL